MLLTSIKTWRFSIEKIFLIQKESWFSKTFDDSLSLIGVFFPVSRRLQSIFEADKNILVDYTEFIEQNF